jgi:hypothetical protein
MCVVIILKETITGTGIHFVETAPMPGVPVLSLKSKAV